MAKPVRSFHKMISLLFPSKKLMRNGMHLLFGAFMLVGVMVFYQEVVVSKTRISARMSLDTDNSSWWIAMWNEKLTRDHQSASMEDSPALMYSFTPQTWKPEYKGKANLHVFDDWCGGSTADLRRNQHYPLYPHSRTTVRKLAVSPQWTNYGLRIFGYLHPYVDGEFVFALSSDDNSEFWLSTDDSPLNLQLLAWVGRTGTEWTAPGEFEKYANQTSKVIWLSAQKKYFFEVIYKQNYKGTDHMEVAWKLQDQSFTFKVIQSIDISLYVDESALLMGDVTHIPQTVASHHHTHTKQQNAEADMLREDPRDSLHQVPLINSKFLQGVLPNCTYKPSYTLKNFPLSRYQGLGFVHMSYVYPNDYTRLTHMETEKSCFYPDSSEDRDMYGFSRYMKLDRPDVQDTGKTLKHGRKLHSVMQETNNMLKNPTDTKLHMDDLPRTQGKDDVTQSQPEPQMAAERKAPVSENPTVAKQKRSVNREMEAKGVEDQEGRDDNEAMSQGDNVEDEEEQGGDFNSVNDNKPVLQLVSDTGVKWSQTFQVSQLDLQAKRTDSIDLRCNISGNLLLQSSDILPIVKAFMDQLNKKHHDQFTLVRVVNIVKRVDKVQGSRYLLELELKDVNDQLLRLSHYIYAPIGPGRQHTKTIGSEQPEPQLALCNPVGFHWNPAATVHFIVPVKNQARWVHQLIADMEHVFRESKDVNFNLIVTDYSSTDMDVKKALEKSSLPRYQYVKLSGNFERAAGLQTGVNLIDDDHSIVFLCDLHIRFPPSIIDSIRKHCVEGYMAFAPIVMRLNCGATPFDGRGFWEVNGFGLLGIYKSDLDAVGGMNTREYKDRWGGEDWELLDRVLKAGLEVERIYLRNFFHYYHSKRGMWSG